MNGVKRNELEQKKMPEEACRTLEMRECSGGWLFRWSAGPGPAKIVELEQQWLRRLSMS